MAEREPVFQAIVDISHGPLVSLSADHRSEIERLLSRIESDESSELQGIDNYRQAVDAAPDAGVKFLLELILEDEERHHRLLQAMADDLRSSLEWTRTGHQLPTISPDASASHRESAQMERFLALEQTNLRDLQSLQKSVKNLESGLLNLLLVTMEDDTKKHIEILEFIKKRLSAR